MPSSLLRRLALTLCFAVAALQSAVARPSASVPILPVSEIKAGMKGYGLTVFSGTRIEQFPVTVLGVIKNYIAESDLILIRVDGGYPAKHGVGIIAGMSGSPVYVNGRLIGAVAYGWPFSKEPIGGVTPIESMLKDLPQAVHATAEAPHTLAPGPRELPHPIRVSNAVLKRVQVVPSSAAARALPRSADTLVLSPVPSLFQVSGFSERAFSGLEKVLRPLNMEPVRTFAAAPPVDAKLPRIAPGSAVGVQLLTGDLEIAGTGTLTYVDGSRFLAFGHPMAQLGDVNLPMTASYVQGILPSYQRPFKFASQIGAIGQLTSDRLWAVGGTFGGTAPMVPVTIHLSEPSRNLQKTYHLRAIQHRFLTSAIVTQAMMEGLNSLVPTGAESTAIVDYHIKPRGREAIDLQQMTAGSTVDTAVAMQFNEYLAQLTNNDFAPLALESVEVDVKILPGKRTATIDRIFTTRSSYRRGDDIDLHVVLHPYGKAPFEQVVRIPIPPDTDKGQIMLGVAGGSDMPQLRKRLAQPRLEASSIDQLLDLMVNQERGQQLIVKAAFPSKAAVIGSERFAFLPDGLRDVLPTLPQSDISVEKDTFEKRVDLDWVVRGAEVINADVAVTVEAGDKKKAEAPTRVLADGSERPLEAAVSGPAPLEKRDDAKPKEEPRKKEPDSTATTDKVLPSGTRRWDLQEAAAFAQGTFDGTSVSTDGNVSLAPRSERELMRGGDVLLSLAREPRGGGLLAGTASQGRVLHVAPGGGAAAPWRVGDAAVTALAVGPDGAVWIGTGPRGRLYRKSGGEAPRLVLDGPSSYVWAVLPQADGSAIVGTGNPARLLRVTADGASRPVTGFTERHVRAVAPAPDGSLVVATAGPGVLYRVRGGQREPLFTSAFGSVDALLVRASGEIVAASGRNVYRMSPGGRVRVLAVSDKPLLALAETPRGVLAGGGGGRIFAIDESDVATRVADYQGGAVTALCGGGEVIAVTAGPGAVVRVGAQIASGGTWMSDVLDAGGAARWGRIRWMGEGGGTIAVQTRSGYTAAPDATWSPWSADCTAAEGAPIGSPPGRYLQVRARLAASGADLPRLTSLSIFFRSEEQQPSVELARPRGGERLAGTQKVQWKASGAGVDTVGYDLSYSADGRTWTAIQKGLGPAVKESAVNTTTNADPAQAEEYGWDTRKVPDGRYRVRLEAYVAARPDGPRITVTSKPFIVANTPPEVESIVTERLPDGRLRVRGVAHSHLAAVVSVAFKQAGREWQIASPDDGFYDSDKEAFTFVLGSGGEVEMRVTDEAGNSRTVKRNP